MITKVGELVRLPILAVVLFACSRPASIAAEQLRAEALQQVALLLDESGSMAEQGRYTMALAGIASVLAALPDGTPITIVLFNDKVRVLAKADPLDDASRTRLLETLINKPRGGTNMLA